MGKRHTYEYIYNYFKEQGCELLSKEYINNKLPLDYICNCGNKSKIRFDKFIKTRKCKKCSFKILSDLNRFDYNYVKEYFESQGCVLLSKEYVNCLEPLDYICNCGRQSKTYFSNFKNGRRCRKCGRKKVAEQLKLDYEYVYNYFKEHGCQLLSKEYINYSQMLEFICSCGNHAFVSFSSFKQQGSNCSKCGDLKKAEKLKYSYSFVTSYFKSQGCKLISKEYINSHHYLEYICTCGNKSKIKFYKFMQGQRCANCAESHGERKIRDICELKNIPHDKQYTFDDLRGINGGLLRFDVSIFCDNEKIKLRMLIEFDGIQHYKWIKGWMTKKEFETLQIHDTRKNEYCDKHNIILVRIPYWDFDNIEEILEQHLNLLEVVV